MFQVCTDLYLEASGDPSIKAMVEAGVPTPSFAVFGGQAQRTTKKGAQKRKMNFEDDAVTGALNKNSEE